VTSATHTDEPAAAPADKGVAAKAGAKTRYSAAVGVALAGVALFLAGVAWSVSIGPTPLTLGAIISGILFGGQSSSAAGGSPG
jgi:hypothetical protein